VLPLDRRRTLVAEMSSDDDLTRLM
jgi:hypothetical protein